MDDHLCKQVYNRQNLKDTATLVEIWQKHDTEEWQPEVFEIVEQILLERLGYLPERPIPAPAELLPDEVDPVPEDDEQLRYQAEQVLYEAEQLLIEAERFLEAGNPNAALSGCERAIQLAPELAEAYLLRGQIYDELGQLDRALADFRQAYWLDPETLDGAKFICSLEKDRAMDFDGSASKRHLDQALAYALNEDPRKALEEIELARGDLPPLSAAYNYLGMIYQQLAMLEPAIDAYITAIRLNPRFYPARENLANARVQLEEERYRLAGQLDGDETGEAMGWAAAELSETGEDDAGGEGRPVPGWMYLDEKGYVLAGWPGHRHVPGRSGYDPLDTDFESAHMQGVIIRRLLTLKFRTHHPVYLLLMVVAASLFCSPMLFGFALISQASWSGIALLLLYIPYIVVGAALWANFLSSFFTERPELAKENGRAFF